MSPSSDNSENIEQTYPAYSEILGPEDDILIIAAGKDYVAYPELVYLTCENGWVDLDEWR